MNDNGGRNRSLISTRLGTNNNLLRSDINVNPKRGNVLFRRFDWYTTRVCTLIHCTFMYMPYRLYSLMIRSPYEQGFKSPFALNRSYCLVQIKYLLLWYSPVFLSTYNFHTLNRSLTLSGKHENPISLHLSLSSGDYLRGLEFICVQPCLCISGCIVSCTFQRPGVSRCQAVILFTGLLRRYSVTITTCLCC